MRKDFIKFCSFPNLSQDSPPCAPSRLCLLFSAPFPKQTNKFYSVQEVQKLSFPTLTNQRHGLPPPYQNCAEQIDAWSGKREALADQRCSLALRDGTFLLQLAPPLHLAVHGKTPCTLISPDHRKVSHLWSPVFCCAPRQVLWSGARRGREVWGSICWSRWDCHPDVGLNPITSIILRFGNGTALIQMFCPTNQFIIFSQT